MAQPQLGRTSYHNCIPSGTAATGQGTAVACSQYRHYVVAIKTTGFTGTIKVQGTNRYQDPTTGFWAAAATARLWEYKMTKSQEDDALYKGDDGIVYAGADSSYKEFRVNHDRLAWLNIDITARSAGSVQVDIYLANDTRY